MTAPLRVAAHNGARDFGGGEKWTFLLLRGLRRRGHEVHCFCRDAAMVERARAMDVDASVGRLGGHLMLPDALRLAGSLRRYAPDVLLVSTFKKLWLAALAGRLAAVPRTVVRIGLSSDLPRRHWTYRLALRRWTDAVLLNADGIRRDFVADLPGYPGERVATVYDGIEPGPAPPPAAAAREALGLPASAPVVGTVARLSGQKRLDRMLEVVERLPAVHLAIAGEGALEGELRASAAALGLAERVHFLGYRSDVETVLAALDVFLLTSDKEGMANAMLEAMAAGVPVVSTPVSGAAEALARDGEATPPGSVVEPDPATLAAEVSRILADDGLRRAMGAAAAARARARFSFEAMLDAWEHVLAGGSPAEVHQGASTVGLH